MTNRTQEFAETIVFQFQQFEAFSNLQLLLVFGQCHRHFSEARA